MAAHENQIGTAEVNFALDQEFIKKFNQEYDRLAEILGVAAVERVAAGTALYQMKVTGALNDAAYVEGDEVALSKYEVEKVPVGDVSVVPYRKQVTAQAILKGGYVPAVLRTDDKMVKDVRADIVGRFFRFLANGTSTAEGKTLQAALAYADAKLEDKLEDNGDSSADLVHFVNRQDIADYLAKAEVTTQSLFGMTYLETFLGVKHVFITNKVEKGKLYVTPAENIRIFGADLGALSQGGLAYTEQAAGLIGVNHEPGYDRVSAYTNVLCGATMFAEVTDYIVKGSIVPEA